MKLGAVGVAFSSVITKARELGEMLRGMIG
jgi:hypothetical protein